MRRLRAMLPVIAKDAGMDEDATAETLATFVFPSVEEQLGAAWFGGTVQSFMKGVADVFVAAGSIDGALDSYAPTSTQARWLLQAQCNRKRSAGAGFTRAGPFLMHSNMCRRTRAQSGHE